MINIELNEKKEVVFIGGSARVGDIQDKGLIKASIEEKWDSEN